MEATDAERVAPLRVGLIVPEAVTEFGDAVLSLVSVGEGVTLNVGE